jgi:hypothetical protein
MIDTELQIALSKVLHDPGISPSAFAQGLCLTVTLGAYRVSVIQLWTEHIT